MKVSTIAIGCDHGGYAYKQAILDLLMERKIAIIDMGPYLCLLYTSPSPRDATLSRMPSSA